MSNWSDELVALTRRHVETMLATPARERLPICMKHWEDRYGLLLSGDGKDGRLMIADITSGAREVFATLDDLIAAGWAID
ncbi:MAG: hypothetical protein JJT95_02460 [Pararhodobacter sp.]|nr:hypothetical protein [Pararhodobacter sp.]